MQLPLDNRENKTRKMSAWAKSAKMSSRENFYLFSIIIVSDVKSYAVLLDYCNGKFLVMWKVKQFLGLSYIQVMQKVRHFCWTASYCK